MYYAGNGVLMMKLGIVMLLTLVACYPTKEREPQVIIIHKDAYPSVQKIAIIVEPRAHPLLVPIVQNVMRVLGDDWKIQIFHSVTNEKYIQDSALRADIESGKVYLSKMLVENNISIGIYNSMMTSSYFWEQVLGEEVILFETDSVMCRSSGIKLSKFSENYDYVGAPWGTFKNACYVSRDDRYNKWRVDMSEPTQKYSSKPIEFFEAQVGNSGFSYRNRKKTLEILTNYVPVNDYYYNFSSDLFYACAFQHSASGSRVPSVEQASHFSVETIMQDAPIGVHKPWLYLKTDEMEKLEVACPEILILKPYYLEKGHPWGTK